MSIQDSFAAHRTVITNRCRSPVADAALRRTTRKRDSRFGQLPDEDDGEYSDVRAVVGPQAELQKPAAAEPAAAEPAAAERRSTRG